MSPAALRRHFPLLGRRQYFASHSLGPVPEGARAHLARWHESVFTGRAAFGSWIEQLVDTTARLEALLGAPPGSVALLPGATTAQAAIAAATVPRRGRDRILTSAVDFHSSRYLWQAQAARGFAVDTVEEAPDGGVTLEAVAAMLRDDTAIVAVAHVSSFTGAMIPLTGLSRLARDAGAITVVDACQSVGIVPIDVVADDVDVLVGCTHKWLGGGDFGLAFAYVRPSLAAALRPAFPGWMGHRDPQCVAPTFEPAPGAARLAQSPVALAPVFAARAGLELVSEVGVASLRAASLRCTARLHTHAEANGLRVRTPRDDDRRGGHVCIEHPQAERIVTRLGHAGIDVDARAGFGIRVAPHPTHTVAECEAVVDAIARG